MAEVDTMLLATQHNDIRKEAVDHTNDIIKESLKGDTATIMTVKDARHDIADIVGSNADRLASDINAHNSAMADRMFTVARDTADLKAQVVHTLYAVDAAADRTAKDTQIAVLQNTIEGQKNTTYLSDKINVDGDRTRALINDINSNELERRLIERNADLVELRGEARHWRGHADQSQFASLNSQLQAFGSQLQETRQGVVNFGSMTGNAGRQTSSNTVV